jgi:hypothetical protein
MYSVLLGLWTLFIFWRSKIERNNIIGSWIFHPQMRHETAFLLYPSGRANLNHWMTHVIITTDIEMPETRVY